MARALLTNNNFNLTISDVANILDINRTSIYYEPVEKIITQEELDCKNLIDQIHTEHPAWGARQLSYQLQSQGYDVGRRKVRRYMLEMAIDAIFPGPNLSKRRMGDMIMPYLLRNVEITKPNQALSIDITYIPLAHSYIYLTAIIDWYSRFVVGWDIDDTLDTRMVISAVSKALRISKPEILNSDQGCQFTSHDYKAFLSEHRIKQSMDGKGRWADNIMIERWFRTLKYEEVYLTQYQKLARPRPATEAPQRKGKASLALRRASRALALRPLSVAGRTRDAWLREKGFWPSFSPKGGERTICSGISSADSPDSRKGLSAQADASRAP